MKEARFVFDNENDLLEKDSSLTLGYFIICNVVFFEESKCILTISLNDLMEGLLNISKPEFKKSFKWTPADSGEIAILKTQKSKLIITYNNVTLEINLDEFIEQICNMAKRLHNILINYRFEAEDESPIVDMLDILDEF